MATQAQKDNFINSIAPIVQAECKRRGWGVPSAIIAQAILESNWGLSGLAKYNNFFGLKCGTSWKGKSVNMSTKEEYTVGTLTTIKDNFRVYDSMTAGVAGYFDFVSTARYKAARTARTAIEYLTEIKKAGYATSSQYVNNNMNLVNTLGLTRFDDITFVAATTANNTTVSEPIVYNINNKYTIDVNLNLRRYPTTDSTVIKTLPKGTQFVCKDVVILSGITWLRHTSGWLCAGKDGKVYVR